MTRQILVILVLLHLVSGCASALPGEMGRPAATAAVPHETSPPVVATASAVPAVFATDASNAGPSTTRAAAPSHAEMVVTETRPTRRQDSIEFPADLAKPVGDDAFSLYVSEKILAGSASMNIAELKSALNMPELTDIEIVERATNLTFQHPQLLTVTAGATIPVDGINLAFETQLLPADMAIRRQALEEAVSDILRGVDWEALSDYEKSLRVHDLVTDRVTYNYDAFLVIEQADDAPEMDPAEVTEAGTVYGALVNGSAVCTGYAQAYTLLAREVGLPVIYLEGPVLLGDTWIDHAWNLVQIEGDWLFVDTTWDDDGSYRWFHLPIAYAHVNRKPNIELLPENYRYLSSETTAHTWFAKHDRLISLDTALETLSAWTESGEYSGTFLLGPADRADVQSILDDFYERYGTKSFGLFYDEFWITITNYGVHPDA